MTSRDKDRDAFLVAIAPFAGANATVFDIVLNHNLQEFSIRAGYICGLESNGSLTPEQAWRSIRALWRRLKAARKQILETAQQFRAASDGEGGSFNAGAPSTSLESAQGASVSGSSKNNRPALPLVIVGSASVQVFDKELQRFAWQLSIVCALEAGGKLTPDEAYLRIKTLYKGMKKLKKQTFPKQQPPDAQQ